jgi:hypothetical protein
MRLTTTRSCSGRNLDLAMTSPLEVPLEGVVSGLCHRKWLGMPGIRRRPGRDSTTLSNLRI